MSGIYHGGRLDAAIARFGGVRNDWLDLSTGINPRPYPVPVLDEDLWKRLPGEHVEHDLYQAACNYYRVPKHGRVIAANGTQAIIQVLPQVLNCKSVSVVSPTYGEHSNCWKHSGREVFEVSSLEEATSNGGVVVMGNPNNPDCRRYQPKELIKAANELESSGGILIVDEAFCDVEPGLSLVPNLPDNAIVLRSFGKFFGLAGIRLGFAICNSDLTEQISRAFGPWAVSGPALETGRIAMSDTNWISKSRDWINKTSSTQEELLADCGLEIAGNAGLFIEASHPEASVLYERLMQVHILLRPFEQRSDRLRFGLCADEQSLTRLKLEMVRVIGALNA